MKKKKKFIISFLVVLCAGVLIAGFQFFGKTKTDEVSEDRVNGLEVYKESNGYMYEKNVVIVIFEKEATSEDVEKFTKKYHVAVEENEEGSLYYVFKFKKGKKAMELNRLVEEMHEEKIVQNATLSFINSIQSTNTNRLWNLNALKIPEAWTKIDTTGKEPIKIGIIDAGFYKNHEDMLIPEENIHSSDGNNLSENENENEHGTHVTGIIAASGDNDIGIDGIVQSKEVFFYKTDGSDKDIQNGILWLAEKGVRVINISMGNDINEKEKDTEKYILKPRDAYTAFLKEKILPKYDILIVQSAGNDRIDAKWNGIVAAIEEPEVRKHILVVGGFGHVGNPIDWARAALSYKKITFPKTGDFYFAPFNNKGDFVDILAPGVSILSTTESKTGYGKLSGTSQAAPHITGLASLLLTIEPAKTSGEIKEFVLAGSYVAIEHENIQYRLADASQSIAIATGEKPVIKESSVFFNSSLMTKSIPYVAMAILLVALLLLRKNKLMNVILVFLVGYIVFSFIG